MENENNTRVWFNKSVTSIALRDAGCAQVFWDGFNNGTGRWTEECVASFLKSLKIPVKFFLGLSKQAMEEVLTSQLKVVSQDVETLAMLSSSDGTSLYATVEDKSMLDIKLEGIVSGEGWALMGEDYDKGVYTYYHFVNKAGARQDAFEPVVIVHVPVLNVGKVSVETGLYKVSKKQLFVDHWMADFWTLKPGSFNAQMISAFVDNSIKRITDALCKSYSELLACVFERNFSYEDATDLIDGYMTALESPFNKAVWVRVMRAIKKFAPGSVRKIGDTSRLDSWEDFINILFGVVKYNNCLSQSKVGLGMYKVLEDIDNHRYMQGNVEVAEGFVDDKGDVHLKLRGSTQINLSEVTQSSVATQPRAAEVVEEDEVDS